MAGHAITPPVHSDVAHHGLRSAQRELLQSQLVHLNKGMEEHRQAGFCPTCILWKLWPETGL